MSVAEDTELEDLRVTKYPKFRVLTGGKGPPEPPEGDSHWLSALEVGTTFTARSINSKDVELNLYHILFKEELTILLKWQLPDGKVLDWYVDPERFSKKFELRTILGVYKQQETTEVDEENGNSNRTD